MDFYQRALELREETVANRRYLHQNAEVGLDLPKTREFVGGKLQEYGLQPQTCGEGITASLGTNGKVLMLRADMDALPLTEESGEPFACTTGAAHACGHDMHASMLLTAARMLKEHENELQGTVKFMFQPAEETFQGSKNMIQSGILRNPDVDAALAFHVAPGQIPVGLCMYNDKGTMMYSVDGFRIDVAGKGSHGAYPQNSIDPINIAVHIYLALEAIIAREVDPAKAAVMTVGSLHAGSAANIIPDAATFEGTIRTNDKATREHVVSRMKEAASGVAATYGGTARVTMTSEVPPLVCDHALTNEMLDYMRELDIPGFTPVPGICASASEDFALIAQEVPTTFMYLSAGYLDERGAYPAHSPKVQFNEDVLSIGPACLAQCATEWLKNNGRKSND